jgi:uncharacterized protein YvpB
VNAAAVTERGVAQMKSSRLIFAAIVLIVMLLALNEYLTHKELAKKSAQNNAAAKKLLDVPLIRQMDAPRLYNGCEVTSLAMLLADNGFHVTKNQLAEEIKYVPFTYKNGQHGNPNAGFVGNMEDGPGYGVYHGPVFELAKKYAGTRAADLTGQPFSKILENVGEGHAVWVVTTARFQPVSDFKTWDTPQGKINITYSEHSVVITGYDTGHIYVNDPYGTKNKPLSRKVFEKAWKQMGSQAIVIR